MLFNNTAAQVAEGRQEELTQRGALEKKELELRIEEMEEKEQVLQARIEALQADNDFTNERLTALQGARSPPLLTRKFRARQIAAP